MAKILTKGNKENGKGNEKVHNIARIDLTTPAPENNGKHTVTKDKQRGKKGQKNDQKTPKNRQGEKP